MPEIFKSASINEEGLSRRQVQVALKVKEIACDFFQRESSGMSLITVTRATVSADLKNSTLFITVLPEKKEEAALDFARRQRTDLRNRVKKQLQIKTIPFFEIEIDYGEKNRQHIDELLMQDKVDKIKKEVEREGEESEIEESK